MSSQNILKNIAELSEIVSGWQREGYAPSIERDIALAKIRDMYELIRFIDMPFSAEELVETAVVVDLEDILIGDSKDETEELVNIDEPIVEPIAEALENAEPELVVDEEVKEPAEQHSEQEVAKDTLFDLDEIPKNTRSRRSAILSLYGYEEDVKPAKVELEHEKVKEPKQEYVEVMLFDDPIPQPQDEEKVEEIQEVLDEPIVEEEVVESIDISQLEQEVETESSETNETPEVEIEAPIASISLGDITASQTVVGDVINSDIETISDHYVTESHTSVVMEQYGNEPIESLSAGLGVNERYLLARDLFDGDAVECNKMIDSLESCETYDDAIIYIAENYMWNADSQGAQMVMNLLERKFNM